MRLAPLILLLACATIVAAEHSPAIAPIELAFWAGPRAAEDSRVVRVYEHPACDGTVAIARVTSMPDSSDEALGAERVAELSPAGEMLRRWFIPVDSIVAGISSNELLVPTSQARPREAALAISVDGKLRPTEIPAGIEPGKLFECPPVAEFGRSVFLRCSELRDLESGEMRRIVYQGPCT